MTNVRLSLNGVVMKLNVVQRYFKRCRCFIRGYHLYIGELGIAQCIECGKKDVKHARVMYLGD